jgi:hypothetical protein
VKKALKVKKRKEKREKRRKRQKREKRRRKKRNNPVVNSTVRTYVRHFCCKYMTRNKNTTVAIILIILGITFAVPLIVYLSTIKVSSSSEKPLTYNEKVESIDMELSESETSFIENIGLYESDKEISRFDGLPLTENKDESPIGVIIENHGLSRDQQSGLGKASVVYETYAEGGITRFLAIYPYQSSDKIGPVRSMRPYFLDWALEHAHTIVHAGGSDAVMENIPTSGLIDIDEDELDDTYLYRDERYEKPHNLFTDMFAVRKSIEKTVNEWHPMPFQFSDDTDLDVSAKDITINFGEGYDTLFSYDPSTNKYIRYQRGSVHKDSLNNKPLSPSNIIIQITDMEIIDDIGRLDIRTKGSGKTLYFSKGQFNEGIWKSSYIGSTLFLDKNNVPIVVSPGQTWIIVIDSKNKVSID